MSHPGLSPGPVDSGTNRDRPDPTPSWVENLSAALAVNHPRNAQIHADQTDQTDRDRRQPSAVLVALVDTPIGPQLLLTRRATTLNDYPGYISLPGGSVEPADRSPVDTALREAVEETGLDSRSVQVIGQLPERPAGASHTVIPVVAWSSGLRFVSRSNPGEVTEVTLVPLAELVKPTSPQAGSLPSDVGPIGPMTAELIAEIAAGCEV